MLECMLVEEILIFAFFGLVTARCIIKLIRAICLRTDIKRGQTVTRSARIVFRYMHPRVGDTNYAKAQYSVDGTVKSAWMVCSIDRSLSNGDVVDIVLGKRSGRIFALSEKQSRNAVMTYAVFSAISVAALIALTAVIIMLS